MEPGQNGSTQKAKDSRKKIVVPSNNKTIKDFFTKNN